MRKIFRLISSLGVAVLPLWNCFGQDSLHLIATMTGEKVGDLFGFVEGIGDINGDGYADFMVGSPETKYCKLYLGGPHLDTVAAMRFTFSNFKGVGDVNGDGFDDVLMARDVFLIDQDGYVLTQVYLLFGGKQIDTNLTLVFERIYPLPSGGPRLAKVGDVNKDGFDDFVISIPIDTGAIGRAYLYLGSMKLNTIPAAALAGHEMNSGFGNVVCGIGDMNGDGFDDYAIGEPAIQSRSDTGKVFIYYGSTTIDTIPKHVILGPRLFGVDISNVGDVNKDGRKEFMVSSPSKATAFLFLKPDSAIAFKGTDVWIGMGGDINRDGFDDLVVGDQLYVDGSGVVVGAVRGYYGKMLVDTLCDFMMKVETKWGSYGKYVSVLGDINGDGYAEIAVGAPSYPDYQNTIGKVYIYSYKPLTSVKENNDAIAPRKIILNQNYPNPFNPTTVLSYQLPLTSHVLLKVFDMLGREVATLVNEEKAVGTYSVQFDASNLPSGIYFARLQAGSYSAIRKLSLLK